MMEVQIFIDADQHIDTVPLHEHCVRYLMHHGISGATVFAGIMGYGAHHHLKEPKRFGASDPVPMMIVFIDTEEKVNSVLPHFRQILPDSLIIAQKVERL